jgi:hypothetical protein
MTKSKEPINRILDIINFHYLMDFHRMVKTEISVKIDSLQQLTMKSRSSTPNFHGTSL